MTGIARRFENLLTATGCDGVQVLEAGDEAAGSWARLRFRAGSTVNLAEVARKADFIMRLPPGTVQFEGTVGGYVIMRLHQGSAGVSDGATERAASAVNEELAGMAASRIRPVTIKFVLRDQETDGVAIEHDGEVAWQGSGFDSFSQYLLHHPEVIGVPVILQVEEG